MIAFFIWYVGVRDRRLHVWDVQNWMENLITGSVGLVILFCPDTVELVHLNMRSNFRLSPPTDMNLSNSYPLKMLECQYVISATPSTSTINKNNAQIPSIGFLDLFLIIGIRK